MSEGSGLDRLVVTCADCGATASVVVHGVPEEAIIGEPVHKPGCPYAWTDDPDKDGS